MNRISKIKEVLIAVLFVIEIIALGAAGIYDRKWSEKVHADNCYYYYDNNH